VYYFEIYNKNCKIRITNLVNLITEETIKEEEPEEFNYTAIGNVPSLKNIKY
jgi:hypothetical protein